MKARYANIIGTRNRHRGVAVLCVLLVTAFVSGGFSACSTAGASSGAQSSASITSSVVESSAAVSSAEASSDSPSSGGYTINGRSFVESSSNTAASKNTASALSGVVYKNTQYGFTFSLPDSWKGYTIVSGKWDGTQNNQAVTGPEIIIRGPKWTAANKYQDIPIMVFTAEQWAKVVKGPSEGPGENLYIGAAPVGPMELGHNAKYAFALPARYDFTGETGVQEVHDIISKNPLQPIG